MNVKNNILFLSLRALQIKNSRSYTTRYYSEHPERGNMLGLSLMLKEYGVRSKSIFIDSTNQLSRLSTPFITQQKGIFVVVNKIDSNSVYFQKEGSNRPSRSSTKQFSDDCSNIVMVLQSGVDSLEHNYHIHHRRDITVFIMSTIACFSVLFLLGIGYFRCNKSPLNTELLISCILDIIGLGTCWMLVQQQLRKNNTIGSYLCRWVNKRGCEEVLNSTAAMVLGIISWAEIGLGYFCANLILFSISLECIAIVAMINALLLPLTFISIWYQKFKLDQWCILCLMVIIILWAKAFSFLCLYLIESPPHIHVKDLIIAGSIYSLSVILSHLTVKLLSTSKELTLMKHSLNRFKANYDVFQTLIKKQPRFNISNTDSHILFGKKDAPINLTILSNPHCNHCATVHFQIRLLMQRFPSTSVRYVFTAFNKQLLQSNRILIKAFFEFGNDAITIFDKWFELGKNHPEKYWKAYPVRRDDDQVNQEIKAHLKWAQANKFQSTPVIIFNGVLLPKAYSISDISLLLSRITDIIQ